MARHHTSGRNRENTRNRENRRNRERERASLSRPVLLALALLSGFCAPLFAQPPAAEPPTGPKVYMMTLTGEFGRDVALTPMREVMADAKREQPDIVVVKLDCTDTPGEPEEGGADSMALSELELARQLDDELTDRVRLDKEWKIKPRYVFWIRRAPGGAGLLAFACPELYCTSDAALGAPDMTPSKEDEMLIRERHRSLRHGRAEGLAIKGGHPVELLRAMTRRDYVLSVSFIKAKPELHPDTSGEILLADDTSLLTLSADMAKRLGLSRGTADTTEELLSAAGLDPAEVRIVGHADDILARCRRERLEAERSILSLRAEAAAAGVKPGTTFEARRMARQEQIRLLKEALELIRKYEAVLSPAALGDPPDALATRLALQIEQLNLEQERDRPTPK